MHAVRWSWTLNLLCRLTELRSLCKSHKKTLPELKVSDSQQQRIIELREVLEPMAILKAQFQAQNLNIIDFNFLYQKAEINLHMMENTPSKHLLSLLMSRKSQMFDSDLMCAGVFLNKRFAVSLSACQLINAKKFISFVHQKF